MLSLKEPKERPVKEVETINWERDIVPLVNLRENLTLRNIHIQVQNLTFNWVIVICFIQC